MKTLLLLITLILIPFFGFTQEKEQDSIKVEKLDEVLVKAVRVDATSPITHSNIEKETLEKRNLGQDLPILLNFLPSVVTTSDAGAGVGYSGIRVRGVSAQSTNITINGIPYNDAESLGTFWVDLPDFSSSVESLQLQRGVGTSTNGAGAFGASINILTDAISEKAMGEISNTFGSYNTRKHTIKFSTGKLNDQFEISGRLSQIKSDGYIDRAESNLKSYFLQTTFVNDQTLIKGLVFGGHEITYQAWNGIDAETLAIDRTFNPSGIFYDDQGNMKFYDNEVDNYKQDHYQFHVDHRFNNNWSVNLGMNYTYGRGYFEQYKEDQDFSDYGLEYVTVGNEIVSTTDLIRRRWLDNDYYVVNANARYRTEGLNITFGGSYSDYDGDHYGEIIWSEFAGNSEIRDRYYEGDGKKNDASFFAKTTFRISNKVQLYGDLQLRMIDYATSGLTSDRVPLLVNKSYNFFNPKSGITYKVNPNNHLYFSMARVNREPSRSDFESNPNIKPEQLNDFEFGWRHSNSNFKLIANAYYMLYNEQLVITGAIDDVGTPIRDNSGKSYRLGLEMDMSLKLSEKLTIQTNATLSSNKNKEIFASIDGDLINMGKTNISFSPEIISGTVINYKPFNNVKNFEVNLLSKYVGKQYMGNTDSEIALLNSYFVSDLNLVWTIDDFLFFDSLVINQLINNIFNKKYVSNGYYYSYDDTWSQPGIISTIEGVGFYPQATTNFLIGATFKF